ncbi:hypothetical protein CSOJ01_07791 [Colletotrichum sojae]|uniref:Uncharacterized protein n=1 Tax=Colletotrichum sojae TaxID=2175907 RepID=A0A8H6MTS1_9PEZI|nr:hypothetical protein CSOJ01_07791 [Colletotrichum sojae]
MVFDTGVQFKTSTSRVAECKLTSLDSGKLPEEIPSRQCLSKPHGTAESRRITPIMPSISDLAHVNNDETEKIPSCYGFWNAFSVPVVCLPIFGLLMLCFPCIKRKRKKVDEEAPPPTAEEVAAVATVVAQSIPAIPAAVKEERMCRAQGG